MRRPAEHNRSIDGDRPILAGRLGFRGVEALDFAPAAARKHAAEARLAAVDDQPSFRRHGANQMMELRLDRREVGKDVGVIELEIVEDRGARTIVDEFRPLVEECGVVLVAFDHEEF